MIEQDNNARLAQLSAFSSRIAELRQEAVNGRKESGIEELWQEDDEYYEGIDEVNQHQSMLKPTTLSGRLTMPKADPTVSTRSTVFVNITQPYVDMAAARVSDMLLPTDDRPFKFDITPIPEVADVLKDESPMPDGQSTLGEVAEAFLADMRKKAKLAEDQVWDYLVEAKWHAEMRRVIMQAARIGSGCMKGPFPTRRTKRKMMQDDVGITIMVEELLKPTSRMIDVRNLYPDPACGDNIHNGNYIFEKDLISKKQLSKLRGTGYIDSEIDEVLKEGPGRRYIETRTKAKDTDQFEVWYFTGEASYEDLIAANCPCKEGETLSVTITMVNDRIIKASKHIFTSGEFPYDVMVWQERQSHWAGIGIGRQVRTSQRMVNAAARNLMDNAGVSAGPQIILRAGVVRPADGEWNMYPMKFWYVDDDADLAQVQHAITSIVIPSLQGELENIIKMALEFAEKATSMPLLLQGQQGTATETVGGMQILTNNSNTVLRRIAKIFDDNITEPHVSRYYEWVMLYGDKDEMKGDYVIDALGSSAFYERDAQNQQIMQLIPLAGNPAFGIDPDRLAIEILKMNKISPERVRFSKEERDAMKQAAQENPPQDPRIAGAKEVAQIKVQGDIQKATMTNESDMAEIQAKQQAMQNEFALKLKMAEDDREHEMQLKLIDRELKMMELAQSQQLSLDTIKAQLADKTMSLQVQKELSYAGMKKQAAMPPTEPAGRADVGHAYEQ